MYGYIYGGYMCNINMGVVSEVVFEAAQKDAPTGKPFPRAERSQGYGVHVRGISTCQSSVLAQDERTCSAMNSNAKGSSFETQRREPMLEQRS